MAQEREQDRDGSISGFEELDAQRERQLVESDFDFDDDLDDDPPGWTDYDEQRSANIEAERDAYYGDLGISSMLRTRVVA